MAKVNTDMERLEVILRELKEAVVVCDPAARILLYNSAAGRLFQNYEAMGLGQSLFRVCAQAPVEHSLRMLKGRAANKDLSGFQDFDTRFVCAAVDGKMLLDCRISRIATGPGNGLIFVFTFEDITKRASAIGRQGYLLEKMIKDLRSPITNLNTAAGNLKDYPEMAPESRHDFEEIIIRESAELTRRFEDIIKESSKISNLQWPLYDVYSADIIGVVARHLKEDSGVSVTMTGVPLWVHADSYLLMLVLEQLVRFVSDYCGESEVDIEALLGDRRVYFDIVWQGEPIPQSAVDSMLTQTLPQTAEGMTLGDVLARHDSEIWSQKHRRQDYSLLRIPVPDSPRQWEFPPQPLPERPEFYDFTIAEGFGVTGAMADHPLSSLQYVVFDTETTGLRPSEGDEILSIAAVRIVNRRILSGERFEKLIQPKRPIPESSLPFLEITDEMVRDEPPVEVVLPQFMSFVADSILVGHNPAIDVQFLEGAGFVFESPVIDTLLMAIVIDKERTNYTLTDICRWLDVDVLPGRTLMEDCFLSAQIFLRLLDLLEEKGILTLGDLIDASRRVAEAKR